MPGFLKRPTKPKARVLIVLGKEKLCLGEKLTGVIRVASEEEFDADEIRVEVGGVAPAAIPPSFGDDHSASKDKILWLICERVSGPLSFRRGFRQEFSFSVTIPLKPCFLRYGVPSTVEGFAGRRLGWLHRLSEKIPPRSGAYEEPETWLQKHPEWRSRIRWTASGVVAVKNRRDVSAHANFEIPLPSLTAEEEESIRRKTRIRAVAVILGLPLMLVGLYLRETWAFERSEIWGVNHGYRNAFFCVWAARAHIRLSSVAD